jgi:glycosyltransferase involved in cell wall biosynthesis
MNRPTNPITAPAVAISVVIPVYNELQTIGRVIDRVLECGFEVEVIVVDDGSTDGTREYLERFAHPQVRCYFHARNHGKGAALRLGFAAAKNPFVIVQDDDLEYDPRDYSRLLEPLLDGRADMVYGSRFLGGPHRVLFFWHYFGNRMITLVSNAVSDLNLTDMETGMKAFRRDRLASLTLSANRFSFEPEITCKAARAGWRSAHLLLGTHLRRGKKGQLARRDGCAGRDSLLPVRRLADMPRLDLRMFMQHESVIQQICKYMSGRDAGDR